MRKHCRNMKQNISETLQKKIQEHKRKTTKENSRG